MRHFSLKSQSSYLSPSAIAFGCMLASMCLISFAARASLPAYLYGDSLQYPLLLAELGTLAVLGAYTVILGGLKSRFIVLVMVSGAALSLTTCEDIHFATERWIAWVLLLIAVGPLNSKSLAISLRRFAFMRQMSIVTGATILSAAWWLVGIPSMGRGDFTGVTCHSMTLGALSGLCGVWALVQAYRTRQSLWIFVYILAVVVGMLAASRAALVALGFATLVAFAMRSHRNPLPLAGMVGCAAVIIVSPGLAIQMLSSVLPGDVSEGLARKELVHSREKHWEARWDEFTSSPYTGVGFASGWLDTAGVHDETQGVEAGSSYIAILSMTGIVGSLGFGVLVVSALWSFLRVRRRLTSRQKMEIACFAAFWFVHLGAEGYVYAVGSMMGMTFWLWVGNTLDTLSQAYSPPLTIRRPSLQARQPNILRPSTAA